MRVVITGSSGQIGSNLAVHCLESGHQVIGIDFRRNEWTDAFESVLMDLTQSSASTSLASLSGWQRPDVVVHLAAHAKVHELVLDPQRALANMVMTHNVLEYCRRAEVPIVFSSSREVYGDIEQHCAREEDADFASCESPYSASKIACEALIYSYARCYDLPFLVCRLSNVYGRYDSDLHRMARVVPWFIHQIFNDEPITVFGPEKVLDFTYVDDCVAALMSGIERLGDGRIKNETVNVASGVGHSLQELAGYVASFAGKEPQVVLAPARTGEIIRYVGNLEKARVLLGFHPKTTLQDGIRHAIAWTKEWSRARVRVRRSVIPRGANSV